MNPHAAVDFFLRNPQNEDEADDGKDRKEESSQEYPKGPEVERPDLGAVEFREAEGREQEREGCQQWRNADGKVPHLLHAADELDEKPNENVRQRGQHEGQAKRDQELRK